MSGDVFLCHPFIVHTAPWPHRSAGPRMIAQPAINAPAGFALDGPDPSPVSRAIVAGLDLAAGLGGGGRPGGAGRLAGRGSPCGASRPRPGAGRGAGSR
jgi:hypothetical protein